MERNGIDRAFEVGLLVVAVIAILLLQFASFIYDQSQTAYEDRWTQIVFVFRVTAIPLFVLVTVWLIAMTFPHLKMPIAIKRRYLKELCWATLGNVLALEIILCNFLSQFGVYLTGGHVAIEVGQRLYTGMIASSFLTLLATWHYRKIDSPDKESSTRFLMTTLLEHWLIYTVSYLLILGIVTSSGFFLQ